MKCKEKLISIIIIANAIALSPDPPMLFNVAQLGFQYITLKAGRAAPGDGAS